MCKLSSVVCSCLIALLLSAGAALGESPPCAPLTAPPTPMSKRSLALDMSYEFPCWCLPIPKPRPLPAYAGCFFERSTITGDWGGARTKVARRGLTTGLWLTHVTQGLLSGGLPSARSGGQGDWATLARATLVLDFDTERAGLWKGGRFFFRGQGRVGEALLERAGYLVNTVAMVPLPDPDIDILAVASLVYRQWLTGQLSVHVGLLDMLDRDLNAFAWGDGAENFLNFAFTASQMYTFVIPPTPLGAKLTYLPTGDPKDIAIKLMVGSHSDLATFNAAPEGVFVHGEAGFGYTLGGLPGRHKFGATYGWSETYEDLERKFPHLPPGTLDPDKPSTWSVDYNWWQFVDTYAGTRRKGWGPFFRFGASDGNPNPYQLSLSGGIGGDAPWRHEDGFGVGGFWTKLSDASATRPLDDEYGFEAFYRIGVTPWLHVSFDIQAVHSALREAETSTLLGIRTRWRF